jgi:hypothetical protein
MSARNFLAGAAVGAVIGALATFALQPNRPAPRISEDTFRSADHVAASISRLPAPAGASGRPADPSPVESRAGAHDAPAPGPTTTAPLPIVPPNTDDAYLRSKFEGWDEVPSIGQLNDRLKAEARDEPWASDMETQMQDYLARRPGPNSIGSVLVECRKTLCRVVSVVSLTVYLAVPGTDLQAALADLPNESLGRELESSHVTVSVDPGDLNQAMEVAMLRRTGDAGGSRP